MTEKHFCDNCGEQVGLSEGQWVYYKPGEMVTLFSFDSPIAPEVKKRADEIKALQEKYFLSFDEALRLIKSSRFF